MKIFFYVAVAALILSCQQKPKAVEVTTPNWHGSMRGLAQTLTQVMPNLVTTSWKSKQRRKNDLQRALKELSNYSKSLSSVTIAVPSQDPSIRFLAEDFKSEILRIRKLAGKKPPETLRPQMRNLARYCIACHTRTQAGSSYFSSNLKDQTDHFDSFERATYLTSLRQYEKAMVSYETALANKQWSAQNPNRWSEGALNLLAISVRVKNNPNLTTEFLGQLFDRKAFPQSLKKAARLWQKNAKDWQKETPTKNRLARVKSLLDQAFKQEKQVKNSGLLLNVRASAILNEYLREGGLQIYREQGFLYYSGVISERLQKLNFSEFPNSYYKACIAVNPKGAFTDRCRQRLKKSNFAMNKSRP